MKGKFLCCIPEAVVSEVRSSDCCQASGRAAVKVPGLRPVTVTEAKQLRLHLLLVRLCAGSWQEATDKVKMAALAAFIEVTSFVTVSVP